MRQLKKYFPITLALTISGCDMFGGPAGDIPENELRDKWRECNIITNPSRTKALACDNYQRECDRRKRNGQLVCY